MRRTFWMAVLFGSLAARGESLKLLYTASVYADAKEARLSSPQGVACAREGRLAVADSGNGRLILLSFRDGSFADARELRVSQIARPTRVQIDPAGDLLVLDGRRRRIARVGAGGDFKGYVEPVNVPGDDSLEATAFRVDGAGDLHVLDVRSRRVVVLGAAGAFKRAVPLPPGSFVDVSVGPQGTMFVVDPVRAAVYAATKDATEFTLFSKSLREYASFPVYTEPVDRGLLLVVDSHGDGIVVLGPDGSFLGRQLAIGRKEGALEYPAQICVDGQGTLFVADRNNNRVQAFTMAK